MVMHDSTDPTTYRSTTKLKVRKVVCRPTVGRLIVYVLGKTCRPSVGRQTANRRPTVGQQTADSRPTDSQLSANRRPTVGQQTANSRPTGFLGSSSSQLPRVEHEKIKFISISQYVIKYAVYYINTCEIPNQLAFKGEIYYVTITTVI